METRLSVELIPKSSLVLLYKYSSVGLKNLNRCQSSGENYNGLYWLQNKDPCDHFKRKQKAANCADWLVLMNLSQTQPRSSPAALLTPGNLDLKLLWRAWGDKGQHRDDPWTNTTLSVTGENKHWHRLVITPNTIIIETTETFLKGPKSRLKYLCVNFNYISGCRNNVTPIVSTR